MAVPAMLCIAELISALMLTSISTSFTTGSHCFGLIYFELTSTCQVISIIFKRALKFQWKSWIMTDKEEKE